MSREWNGSQVMDEFAKIAAESGLITSDFGTPVVGNPDKETPVKDHRRYEPGEEYGVTKETGEDLVGEAHPKDAKPAEAMGDGGLVENIVQQQEKDIEVATRMPTGALVGKHAELVKTLVSLANELEGDGKAEIAARIDQTIERISGLPFVNGLHREAAWLGALLAPLKLLFWGGAAGTAAVSFGPGLLSKLTSTRDELAQDIQDVIEVVTAVREDAPSMSALADKLRTLLLPYVAKFRKPIPAPGDEIGLRAYLDILGEFGTKALPDASELVTAMTSVKGGWLEGAGLGPKSRLTEKFKDMQATFHDTLKAVQAAAKVGKEQIPEPAAARPELPIGSDIAGIQKLLVERGLEVPQSGKLDSATKSALRQLEKQLDAALRRDSKLASILEQKGWAVSGLLLRQDGTVADVETLHRLIALADRASDKG